MCRRRWEAGPERVAAATGGRFRPPSLVEPLAPGRYKVQLTASHEAELVFGPRDPVVRGDVGDVLSLE